MESHDNITLRAKNVAMKSSDFPCALSVFARFLVAMTSSMLSLFQCNLSFRVCSHKNNLKKISDKFIFDLSSLCNMPCGNKYLLDVLNIWLNCIYKIISIYKKYIFYENWSINSLLKAIFCESFLGFLE